MPNGNGRNLYGLFKQLKKPLPIPTVSKSTIAHITSVRSLK